jgi:hypothetical protein
MRNPVTRGARGKDPKIKLKINRKSTDPYRRVAQVDPNRKGGGRLKVLAGFIRICSYLFLF